MKRLIEILCRPVTHTQFRHDGGHALIAAGSAAVLLLGRDANLLTGWPVVAVIVAIMIVGCYVSALLLGERYGVQRT